MIKGFRRKCIFIGAILVLILFKKCANTKNDKMGLVVIPEKVDIVDENLKNKALSQQMVDF